MPEAFARIREQCSTSRFRAALIDEEALPVGDPQGVATQVAAAGDGARDLRGRVTCAFRDAQLDAMRALGDNLRVALIVSQVAASSSRTTAIRPRPSRGAASGEKCARCWKYGELGADHEHPALCADCATVTRALGERRA